MAIVYCGVKRFKQIIRAGADWVMKNRDYLNKINVFPIPDGDTGSNMSKTLTAAVREMEALGEASLDATAKAAAWGALIGARGNSGIILSQVLSGLTEGIGDRHRLFAEDIVSGFSRGVKKAYHAVLHPTEGTILTVVRETAEAAEEAVKTEKDLARILDLMVTSAKASVERTPMLLPKLAEAGVVDSGGLGFLYFIEGMLRLLQGEVDEESSFDDEAAVSSNGLNTEGGSWIYRYCTEFILKGSRISEEAIRTALSELGESIVVVGDTRLARVHIHTGQPEEVLRYASTVGKVSSIKVDDMLLQHTASFDEGSASKTTSVIAVALGDGLKELFYNAGAELVVDGGPTLNPSTADMITAIEEVNSSNVIILPNHKNVYPAAIQAAERTPKNVFVLKTGSVPEGISALLAYMDDASTDENVSRMEDAFRNVKSGETARASRDVVLGDLEIASGESIGIFGGEVRCSCACRKEAVLSLVKEMADASDEIITIFHGDSVEKEEAEDVKLALQSSYKDKVVELCYGGQPYAHYIVSVE